ncbi:MAG: type II secretion system F family protein [Lachnospiraceae bacterium]
MDYRKYSFTGKEAGVCLFQAVVLLFIVDYLFYQSILGILPLTAFIPIWFQMKRQQQKQKRKERMSKQFGDFLQAVSGALSTGYSVERAFAEGGEELARLYGEKSEIAMELKQMHKLRSIGKPLEEILQEFAQRSGIEEIETFSHVFRYVIKSGGNLIHIIQDTQQRMAQRIQAKMEVELAIWSKRTEQRVMSVVPLGILFYVRFSNPTYLDVLYKNRAGVLIMTICLLAYLGAVLFGERILKIQW